MIKKRIPFIFILLCLACTPKGQKEVNLIELVPQNTSWVAQVNDSLSLKNATVLSKIFSLNGDLKKTIQNLNSQASSSPQLFFITPEGKNKNVLGLITKKSTEDSLLVFQNIIEYSNCLLYTSPSPRDGLLSRMPSSA